MIFRILGQILYTILLIIETLIAIRFVLMLIGANAASAFVKFIYDISYIFIEPFSGIINADWHVGSFYIDVDALVALVIYMILAFVVIEIIRVFTPKTSSS